MKVRRSWTYGFDSILMLENKNRKLTGTFTEINFTKSLVSEWTKSLTSQVSKYYKVN